MKKFLAVLLAVLMVVTCFAACGEKNPNKTDPDKGNTGIPNPDGDTTHTHAYVEGKCECGAIDPNYVPPHQHTFVEGQCECGETDPNYNPEPEEIVFDDVDEVVYVDVATLTLRGTTEFGIESNIKGYVAGGTQLKRTGYHKDWSRIEYEGEIVYCATNCLTTVNPNPDYGFEFTDVNETVVVDTTAYKQEDGTLPSARYYTAPVQGVDEYVAGFLEHGTKLVRTGVYYEPVAEGATDEGLGWSRITIDGVNYYIRNSMLAIDTESTPDTPAVLPEGYTEKTVEGISFAYPSTWIIATETPLIIIDSVTASTINVTSAAKAGVWTEMTAEIYTDSMKDYYAAMGMTISDVTVEQHKNADGDNVTKISHKTMTETNPAGMIQTQFIITVGELDYCLTITESVVIEGLVDTILASLKAVK